MKLPDFPWDALAPYGKKAQGYSSGFIDLSQGTPVDATPEFIQEVFRASSNSPSYPTTVGTADLQQAIRDWAVRQLGASGDFAVLPLIGSKEIVAMLPTILEANSVLYPEIAYPTYLVGAMIAKAKAEAVDFDATNWPMADLAWINSPSNPTGRVHSDEEIFAAIDWARKNGIAIFDECYLEFGDYKKPKSVLALTGGNNKNILAVHSLSKRSNMAGYRAAMLIGDPDLVAKILEVRKHAGGMVPLPVQNAMVAALTDSDHVAKQRDRYNSRRAKIAAAIEKCGFKIEFSEAGLYLWATRNEEDWQSVDWFAAKGILVTPGHFYGSAGSKYVRIALTATDAQIDEVVNRLTK